MTAHRCISCDHSNTELKPMPAAPSERPTVLAKRTTMKPMSPMKPMKAPERWWPEELGENPNSAGGQNETGDHRISGVQQHQSGSGRKVTFTSQHGEVDLGTLKPA
jgi:hypothetical protein